jgi:transcriptional regulator with XRE-family HTH domain
MYFNVQTIINDISNMITAAQLRAARALLGIDQRRLAELSGLSVPTIQRMEASDGVVRGNVDSLMKLIAGLDSAGIELIGEGEVSKGGGRGVRLKGQPEYIGASRDGDTETSHPAV